MKTFILIIILASIVPAQNQPVQKDTLIMRTGEIKIGEVKLMKETSIDFFDSSDELTYEIKKSSINKIILKSGKEIQFMIEERKTESKEEDKWDSWKRESPESDNPSTCLIVGGTAGLVILILAVIGALAQK